MTEVYTDSSNGPETIQDRSLILEGKGSKREGKTSPRLGQRRRSSRIRKRDGTRGAFSDSSDESDDSDPNIQMGEDILIADEEKMILKDESKIQQNMDMNQRAEKQILAVALMKSVLENNKQPKIKLEQTVCSGSGGNKNNRCNSDNINQSKEAYNDNNTVAQTDVKKEEVDAPVPALTHACNGVTEKDNGHLTNTTNGDTNNIIANENVPTTKLEENIEVEKVTKLKSSSNIKATTYRGTRSRTKGSKGGRTMPLKGAYASIREAPRIARKPSVTLPVPNPILPSPAPQSNITQLKEQLVGEAVAAPSSCTISNSQEQDSVTTRNFTTNHPGNPSANNNTSSNFPTRRRIFSIDIDPEGFDFDLSMGVTCNSPSVDYVDSVSALPPITSSSNINGKRDYDSYNHNNTSELDSSMSNTRYRGMSFELFSFNHHESLPSSDPIDLKEEALNGGRPRGDSIIFDPVSFSEGGIHEENALQRMRQNSIILDDTDEVALLNTPGFVEVTTSQLTRISCTPSNRSSASNQVRSQTKKDTTRVSKSGRSNSRQNKAGTSNGSSSKSKFHSVPIILSGIVQNSENTIHMPQGSAAAAAAASLSSQIIPCSLNGTISHTACPMELLNKGGRIGIYLPDARRERIAKFHSKRKNRIWRKRIKYDCRKKLADSRPRIKGRFVKSLEE